MHSIPTKFYMFSETRIELTVVKTLLENIIERPPLIAGPGDAAQEHWVKSLLNLLSYMFSYYVFPNCLCICVFCNLIDPLHKVT